MMQDKKGGKDHQNQNNAEFVQVIPVIKKYDWGKRENTALTKIYSKNLGLLIEDNQEPYAELWYGSHISSPSVVEYVNDGNTIDGNVSNNNTAVTLDDVIVNEFKGEYKKKLPFLLKILSISKPLSLQVHPDANLAKELNLRHPEMYPDDNHKPEIAIALTEFEAFCGFQTTSSIISNIEKYPEIKDVFGFKSIDFKNIVNESLTKSDDNNYDQEADPNFEMKRELFVNMLLEQSSDCSLQPSPFVNKQELLGKLVARIENTKHEERTISEHLILRLNEYYPLDIGILSPLLLNYYKLKPGDAIFIGPGTIHSYISGECIECMANSDNVIRCGLTPKYKDVNTLIKAVNFQKNHSKVVVTNNSLFSSTLSYIYDYSIDCINEYHIKTINIDEYYNDKGNESTLEFNTFSYSPTLLVSVGCGGNNSYFIYLNDTRINLFPGKALFMDSNVNVKFPRPLDNGEKDCKQHVVALVNIPINKNSN